MLTASTLEVRTRLQAVRRPSPFELAILVPSHLHTAPRGSVSGLGSRSVQVLWSYKREGVLQNLHPLTNFKATIPAQASAIAVYSRRTESTVNLVTVWTVACSSYPSPFASSLKAQPTNECLSLLHSVYSHVNCIERPMKIEIVVDPLRPAPPASLASRVAPAPSTAAAATEPRGARFVQQGLLRPHLCLTN